MNIPHSLGNAADEPADGKNGTGNTAESDVGKTGATTSTSTGTRDVRPRIDAEQWSVVEAEALRRGVTPGELLSEMIGWLKSGRRRGDGAWTMRLKALDVLMRHVTWDLIRYEGAILDFIDRKSPAPGLADVEADDHRDALARLVIGPNSRLKRAVSQLRELLHKGIPSKGKKS